MESRRGKIHGSDVVGSQHILIALDKKEAAEDVKLDSIPYVHAVDILSLYELVQL